MPLEMTMLQGYLAAIINSVLFCDEKEVSVPFLHSVTCICFPLGYLDSSFISVAIIQNNLE